MSRAIAAVVAVVSLLVVTQHFIGRVPPGPAGRRGDGREVLRMRRCRYASLAALALAPGAIVTWIVLTLRPTPEDWAPVLLASAIVTTSVTTGLWCLAAEFRACVLVGASGLDQVGVLGHRLVAWTEITHLAHNPANGWFFLTLEDGTHLWLWDDLNGIAAFARAALARLPAEALRADPGAREVLRELSTDVAPE